MDTTPITEAVDVACQICADAELDRLQTMLEHLAKIVRYELASRKARRAGHEYRVLQAKAKLQHTWDDVSGLRNDNDT